MKEVNQTIFNSRIKAGLHPPVINHPALKRPFNNIELGIKKVGIGKKGSKEIDSAVVLGIVQEIKNKDFNPISLGALLAGLIYKGPSEKEEQILIACGLKVPHLSHKLDNWFDDLFNWLKKNFPEEYNQPNSSYPLVLQLKKKINLITTGKNLNLAEAEELGEFLLKGNGKENIEEFFRGFFISYLRVRYESRSEWLGLLNRVHSKIKKFDLKEINPAGKDKTELEMKAGEKKIGLVLSEPFNGFNHQFFLTPLLGKYFKEKYKQFIPFHLVGRNSGPKFKYNLLDVSQGLEINFLKGDNLKAAESPWGYFLAQRDYAKCLDHWVPRRWLTIKRPAWATLEKFAVPLPKERVFLITSAFHPPYLEKMVNLIEDFGFKGGIVSKLGLEGGLIPSLTKPFKLIATKFSQLKYIREQFSFRVEDLADDLQILNKKILMDKKFPISLSSNLDLIKNFFEPNFKCNQEIRLRFQLACLAYDKALQWLESA